MNTSFFSFSDCLEIVFRHLKAVYGERGDLDYNLERYWNSEMFHSACRVPKSLNDIPEATIDDLHALCDRENTFKLRSESLIEQFDKFCREGKDTTEVLLELGGYFGICPGNVDWSETMFPHFVDLFVSSDEEGAALNRAVEVNTNLIAMSSRLLINLLRKNHLYEHEGREVLSYGYARNFFRGENAYYGSSKPVMFRGEIVTDESSLHASRLASGLRIAELFIFIESIPFVKTWPKGSIYHAAIAQHYGLPTTYIDVTSDIKTALFFACTKWDKEHNCWRPLKSSEYEKSDSRDGIAKLHGDSRYGILHIAPADVSAMADISQNRCGYTVVHPIGVQPLMRCHYQNGYIVKGNPYYDLYKDPAFNEVKFRLTEEICDWIYNDMDQGKQIYPYESLKGFEEKIDLIKKSNVFSKKAFDMQFDQWRTTAAEREDELKNLTAHGYRIEEDFCVATPEEIASIDRALWESDAFKELDSIEVSVNPIFVI